MVAGQAPRVRSTARDSEEYAQATAAARGTREQVAAEVAAQIADQVCSLIMEGDIMGGRSLLARRIEQVLVAERRGDPQVLRSALMDLTVAGGAWIAAMDFSPPQIIARGDSNTAEL